MRKMRESEHRYKGGSPEVAHRRRPNSADATGVESTVVSMEHGEFKKNKKVLTDKKKRYYSEIVDPGMLLNDPALANKICRRTGINCLTIRVVGPALKLKLVEIARQVQWKSKQSNVHLGGGVTHQLKDISDITALLGALIADILGERKLAGGCTGEDIYVTQVFVLR